MAGHVAELEQYEQTHPMDGHALRVLVVDDYPDTVESMAILLRMEGYAVEVAQDGAAALQLARTIQPDVVLLDISLPGMDGYEVARQLRSMNWPRPPLLIAITARAFDEDLRRCRDAGIDFHLVKPADPIEVEYLLHELAGSL